jgi:hypothetical protein
MNEALLSIILHDHCGKNESELHVKFKLPNKFSIFGAGIILRLRLCSLRLFKNILRNVYSLAVHNFLKCFKTLMKAGVYIRMTWV